MAHRRFVALAATLVVVASLDARSGAARAAPTAPAAPADMHAIAPSGGGLPPLDVKVDLARGVVVANGAETTIPIDRAALPAERAVTVETVPIGEGRYVAHVRVPLKSTPLSGTPLSGTPLSGTEDDGGPAWEAILAGGQPGPIFAGMTGPVAGDPGERAGKAVRVVANGATNFVLVGDTREDLTICGQPVTLLDPRALYPRSLELRPATVQRLGPAEQANAEAIQATEKAGPIDAPLAQLLVARGSSVPGSRGAELTDGDPNTVWREMRPGVGQGEFVVMSAPKALPMTRVELTVSPPNATPTTRAAGPRTFYLVTTTGAFEVTMPSDGGLKPGAAYQVVFPHPVETSCLSVVLDGAFPRGLAHPDVGIAELRAYSEFDVPGASLGDVAKRLSSDRALAAAELLQRAGPGALRAVEDAYDGLDERGRALAVDVATSHDPCEEAVSLLARGLCEARGEAPRKAREKLERCKASGPELARRLREDAASRACIAPALAAIAPDAALEPIADALASTGEAEHETRAILRDAFAHALEVAPHGRVAAILGNERRSAEARLEIMRAAAGHLAEAQEPSDAALAELLAGDPPMRVRYLVLEPLGELARAGDRVAAARIAAFIGHDPEWPVRARAAGIAAALPEAAEPIVAAAAKDPEPRVREAALGALATLSSSWLASSPRAVGAAVGALVAGGQSRQDEWWFVKTQGVAILAKAPPSKDVDAALGASLRDSSVRVRGAAVIALGVRRASAWGGPVAERLDDAGEDAAVRAAAARALGALCDEDSDTIARLTAYARGLASDAIEDDARQIGFGALVGLAALKPRDLRDRVAPLLAASAPPYVRAAAKQALAARSMCR